MAWSPLMDLGDGSGLVEELGGLGLGFWEGFEGGFVGSICCV